MGIDDSEDDYQTDNSDFSEHNNDNDNDYGDDNDDDENYDQDEQAGDWTNQIKRVWKLRKQIVII